MRKTACEDPKVSTADRATPDCWARDRERRKPHHSRGIGKKRTAVVVQTVEAVTDDGDLDAWGDVFDNMAGAR